MTAFEKKFRRNFIIALVLHIAVVLGIVLFEGLSSNAHENTPAVVELITPADILGDLPVGPGQGRGAYAPPAPEPEAPAPSAATFTPEERPVAAPKVTAPVATSPNDILIPKKTTAKPAPKPTAPAVAAKKPTTKPKPATASSTAKPAESASDIRQRFARALQVADAGGGGTPYGDGNRAGGGSGKSDRIGSPDGAIDGIPGGVGKGSPHWSYFLHVHDRMYEAWEQPGQALRWDTKLVTTVLLRVARDGRIVDVRMRSSSGNKLMDDSAISAARSVPRLDPLPDGLGGETAEISVNFRLEG